MKLNVSIARPCALTLLFLFIALSAAILMRGCGNDGGLMRPVLARQISKTPQTK